MSHRIMLHRGHPAFHGLLSALLGGGQTGGLNEDLLDHTQTDEYENESPIAAGAGRLRDAGHAAIGAYVDQEIATLPSLPPEVQAEIDQAKAAAEQAKQALTSMYESMQRAAQSYTKARNADKLLAQHD
jgi:hypothetical protein